MAHKQDDVSRMAVPRLAAMVFAGMLSIAITPRTASSADLTDFTALCEANQVYDTGKPTSEEERQVCRCIQHRLGPTRERAAIQVFQKVLEARRNGLGLHPSQVDLDELVALMSFTDNLKACTDARAASHTAF